MLPQAPNSVSLNQTNVELGKSPTAAISMNDTNVRALTGNTTNLSITDMYNLRGKSAYTFMSGSAYGDEYREYYYGSVGTQYTKYLYSTLNLSGGVGPFTYLWEFTSNPGGYAMANGTTSQVRVAHTITKYGYTGECTLRVTITDSTGRTFVINDVYFYIEVADQPV